MTRVLLTTAALVALATGAVFALPGQTLKAVCSWAKASNDLRNVDCATGGSEGESDYISAILRRPNMTIPGRLPEDNSLFFEAHPDANGNVVEELVIYHHLPDVPSIAFDRKGGKGLDIVRDLYGDGIANDFSGSRHVTHDASGKDAYRGKLFLYYTRTVRQNNSGADLAHQTTIDDAFAIVRADSVDQFSR